MYGIFKGSSEQDMAWYVYSVCIYCPWYLLLESVNRDVTLQIWVPPMGLGTEVGPGMVGSHCVKEGVVGNNQESWRSLLAICGQFEPPG